MTSTNMKNSREEINLINIFGTLFREKYLISIVVIFSSILSTIYSSKLKPIYSGSFEILVSEKNKKTQSQSSQILGLLTNQKTSGDLATEKLILTSPIILQPVLDYVNDYKTVLSGKVRNKKFKRWVQKNLIVNFKDDSNVLQVTYMDTNKDLILNVLNQISQKYQDYSKSSAVKSLEERSKYLSAQKIVLSKKLDSSRKAYNKFTIDNGLGNIDGFINLGNINYSSTSPGLNNKLNNRKSNELELTNIENEKSSPKTFKKANTGAGQRFQRQFQLLEQYESDFVDLSSKLKPNSKTLQNLKVQIDNLKESLKRPNEILIKYDELYKTYMRDEKLLNLVEDSLAFVKLEQVRNLNTWEIISYPLVGNGPIYPKKDEIFILFLIGSITLGSFLALIKEKISRIIFPIEDFESRLNCSYIDNLSKKNNELSFNQILNSFNLNSKKGKKYFGIINHKNKVDLEFLKDFINTKEDIEVIDFTDVSFIKECDQAVLIIESGKYTFEEIEIMNKYISLSKEKVIGWFFIKN